MSSLSSNNTFDFSPGKQTYLCSINEFWASRLKFLARTNYLPLNERLFKINLCESSKCNICDDDIVEDLHHFLFECKILRSIRQELFLSSFYITVFFTEVVKRETKLSVLKLREKSPIKNCSFRKGGNSENARSG
jgi:hypothetical protein